MKPLLCLLLFISTFRYSAAQLPLNEPAYIDSLGKALPGIKPDSLKAYVHFTLSYALSDKDTTKAFYHLEQGRLLARKYPYLRAAYRFYLASIEYEINPDKAKASYLLADKELSPFKNKEAYALRGKAWHDYAVLVQHAGDGPAYADILLNKSIPLLLQSGDNLQIAKTYHDIGLAFMNTIQFGRAAEYYLLAIDIMEHMHPAPAQLGMACTSATLNYLFLKKTDSAGIYLNKAKTLLAVHPESRYYPGYCRAAGMFYQQQGQYVKAIAILDKGITAADQTGYTLEADALLYEKIKVYLGENKQKQARDILMYLLTRKTTMTALPNRMRIYITLADVNKSMGNLEEAYEWQKKFIEVNDSATVININASVSELELKYKKAEHEKKIALLKAANEKAALSAKNNKLYNLLLTLVSVFLLVVAALVWLYARNQRRLSGQKILNYQQQLQQVEQQRQMQLQQAIMQGEEQERERVARDLHDGLGGMLAGLKLNLSRLPAITDHTAHNQELDKITIQLDNSVHELRHIARNMMPETLFRFGLPTAIKDLCESFAKGPVHIDFQSFHVQENIIKQTQVIIYRIIQELLSNAIRHSSATHIVLQCSQNNNTFFITIEDNGKGFDTRAMNKIKGMGLGNIQKRTAFLNGRLEINSTINEGTTINIELNVDTEQEQAA